MLAFYVFKCVYKCLSPHVMRAIDMRLIKGNLLTYLLTYLFTLLLVYSAVAVVS